ncbi:hypothetical protein B0H17DRAFT_1173820 [Mycena rosella]|uniref:Uncharacterized protein n=1 Tax=Mycena rosella TaxID=1033263 RepID=A0AAD7H1C6_MYCRO|nr:hypothetical protein B0H17DRAFT_1173820 [Mycena rosella]
MSVSIDIVPLAASLDMYGEPDKSSAFSLSGHVSIALNSSYSVFERRRPARILLESVLLTFDGQTEVITTSLGYSPLRLCTISREMAPYPPIELSNEGHEDTNEPCRWNVVFDLPIPGWLPASHDFAPGDLGASTQYFLHAQVKFIVVEDHSTSSWSFTTLCSPFRSRTQTLETFTSIALRRFIEPPTDEPAPPRFINYLLSPPPQPAKKDLHIPSEILSKIQVLASVSKYVDVCEGHLPFILRLRTKDLEDADCKRLQVSSFKVDVVQEEKCRRIFETQFSEFESRHPIPSKAMQPPHRPLFSAHHLSDMYQLGLYVAPASSANSMVCITSLLPPGEPGVYHLSGDNHVFAEDAVKDAETWYTMETSIPFTQSLPNYDEVSAEWAGALKVRPSSTGPLYDVAHSLKLTVHCTYDIPDSEQVASAHLTFCIPFTFGRVAPPLPSRDILPALFHSMRLPDGAYPPLPPLLPFGANLPAYSQLFDSQGNRKMDATPLPLYTPRSSSDSLVDLPPSDEKQDELDATTL